MVTNNVAPRLQQELAQELLHERERLAASLRALASAVRELSESQGTESDAGGAAADVASDLAEESVQLTLQQSTRGRLAEVEHALRRLDEGRYGECERCGQGVEARRLYALPWTRFCLACAGRVGGR